MMTNLWVQRETSFTLLESKEVVALISFGQGFWSLHCSPQMSGAGALWLPVWWCCCHTKSWNCCGQAVLTAAASLKWIIIYLPLELIVWTCEGESTREMLPIRELLLQLMLPLRKTRLEGWRVDSGPAISSWHQQCLSELLGHWSRQLFNGGGNEGTFSKLI